MSTALRAFALLGCLLLATLRAAAAAPQPDEWLAISDIHFDPLAEPKLAERLVSLPADRWRAVFATVPARMPGFGSDSDYALLESALRSMRDVSDNPPVVVITGDFLAHNLRQKFDAAVPQHGDPAYDAFVDKAIRFLAFEFRSAFPRARLIPVIGNNDSYCGDYRSTPHSPFLSQMAASWGASVGVDDPAAFVGQFGIGGYYTVPLPASNAQAVVLNDVYWSAQYSNACGSKTEDAGGDELGWLARTLGSLAGKNVWVLAHIPPGVDVFATEHAPQANAAPVLFLSPRFNDGFINALDSTTPRVLVALTGHVHMNDFRVAGPDVGHPMTPILVLPSLSPIFGNAPSFVSLRVDPSNATLQDVRYFTYGDGHWSREFDFDSVYGGGSIDANHLWGAQRSIFGVERVRRRFEEYYDGGTGRAPIVDGSWRAYWCANVALRATDYQACAEPQIQRDLPPHPTAPPSPTPSPAATSSPQ